MKIRLFKTRTLLLTALFVNTTFASDFVAEQSIRDISLGGITIGTKSPVSIAGQNSLPNQLFASYRDKFSMKELAITTFGCLCHSSFMTSVLSVSTAGYEDYRQTLVSLHAQKMLSEKLSLGVALKSMFINSITLEKNLWHISPAIGAEYQVNSSLTLGVNVLNPVKINSEETEQLDSQLHINGGASYRISDMLLLAAQYEWIESEDGNLKIGAEYSLIPEFRIRAGMNSHPFSPTIGCGYSYQKFTLDVAAEQHRYLGTSLSVGLSYRF